MIENKEDTIDVKHIWGMKFRNVLTDEVRVFSRHKLMLILKGRDATYSNMKKLFYERIT